MGIMQSTGGKGSASRPLSVVRETFESNFDRIFGKKKVDPVKSCETYNSPESCVHVDSFLCDTSTCSDFTIKEEDHPLAVLLAAVPLELYNDSTWVRDICEEANKVLVELDRLKKEKST